LLAQSKSLLPSLKVLPYEVTGYNTANKQMEFYGGPNCPKEDFVFISDKQMKKMARDGDPLPEGFMPQKAWEVLTEFYKQ